jgi:hypothetical protein
MILAVKKSTEITISIIVIAIALLVFGAAFLMVGQAGYNQTILRPE